MDLPADAETVDEGGGLKNPELRQLSEGKKYRGLTLMKTICRKLFCCIKRAQ